MEEHKVTNKNLTENEFNTLISLSKKVLCSTPKIRKKIQEHKVNIVPANFDSSIPLIKDIENSFEYQNSNLEVYNSNIFNQETISNFIEQLCVYADEFNPPLESDPKNPTKFFWKNPAFSFSDAMSYYCVIRHLKPDCILEIGSGYSTLVADQALKKNGQGKLIVINPYPQEFLVKLESVGKIIKSFVQDIPVRDLVELIENCQIWFIDSTHTVKVGSDCLYLYLKIMPEIRQDILVHTHAIHLPFGFPKKSVLEKQIYWTEQYLLYAYMLDNPKIEVLFGSAYAYKKLPDLLKRLMSKKYPEGGSSLWYQLKGLSYSLVKNKNYRKNFVVNQIPSKFIIICAPRTGSTMLRMALNSHPHIICHGEVISLHGKPNLGRKYQKKIDKTSDELATIRSQDPVHFLYKYVLNHHQKNCEAVGVKIKYRQLEEEFNNICQEIVNDKTISIIHLTRKNLLKRYISNKLAGAQKTPTVITDSTAKKEQPKIVINVQDCLENISSVKEAEIRFREQFKNHKLVEIVYEDLIADQNNQIKKLQNFLGINPIDLQVKTVKINSDNLEDIVENYQELVMAIKETPYVQYLD